MASDTAKGLELGSVSGPLIYGEGNEELAASAPERLTTCNESEVELLRPFHWLPARRRKALLEMID